MHRFILGQQNPLAQSSLDAQLQQVPLLPLPLDGDGAGDGAGDPLPPPPHVHAHCAATKE